VTIKAFGFFSALTVVIGLLLIGITVLCVWAIDAGLVQIPTLAYAAAVVTLGLSAVAARAFYPDTRIARTCAVAFFAATVIATIGYAGFRWHSGRHRFENVIGGNSGNMRGTAANVAPVANGKDQNKEANIKPRRQKK